MKNSDHRTISAGAELEPDSVKHTAGNAALSRCIRAWQSAYNEEFAASNDDYEAGKAGLKAFRLALPPLAGHQNVCDFIACITYAMVNEITRPNESHRCLEAAKIALGTVRHDPEQRRGQSKRRGRPTKNPLARENK